MTHTDVSCNSEYFWCVYVMHQLLFIINSYLIRFVKNWSVKNNLNLISITYILNFRIFGTSLISQ